MDNYKVSGKSSNDLAESDFIREVELRFVFWTDFLAPGRFAIKYRKISKAYRKKNILPQLA